MGHVRIVPLICHQRIISCICIMSPAAQTTLCPCLVQAASPLARGWQPLNSRLDSALDYMNRSTDLRISRSDLQLGMLPTIASPGRSANDADELESGAGSNRSPPSVQRVIGSETASGTDVLRTPGPSPERWPFKLPVRINASFSYACRCKWAPSACVSGALCSFCCACAMRL